ncbi:MAG: 2-oxo acid dehydrogenase subunit E2 [SAR202 cluster bacterium]|nr:2-oxo acid dehydrogenase subunit E2 [SAR202 cluster bacterium]
MINEVTMPSMGADMTEGTIAKWLKAEGDQISRGDKLAEIETDKTVVEMEAYADGVLRRITVEEGSLVQVGTVIAYIGDPEDEIPEAVSDPVVAESDTQPSEQSDAPAPADSVLAKNDIGTEPIAAVSSVAGGRVKASPIARKIAAEKGIDITTVPGTGPGSRITKADVENFTPSAQFALSGSSTSAVIDGSDIVLSSMRQAIARVTVRSKTEAPHYYVTHEVNMSAAMTFRTQLNEALDDEVRVSVNDMVLKAVTASLVKYPKWNSTFDGDKLLGHSDINLGVAIALDEGLIVPAVMGIQKMTLVEISQAVRDLGRRARGEGGTLTQDELTKGTFGTSNLGMFGTDTFAAIIVPPNAGIIAVGAVKEKPIVSNGEVVVGQMMNATISADHRVGDGAEAAIFLSEFQKTLENPVRLML